jgi:PAS domain S-box-containing protein
VTVSELQLNSLAKALEADQATFRALADAIPNFVFLTREDGDVVFLNAPMRAFTGLAPNGGPNILESLIHSEDRSSTYERWHRALASGADFAVEFRLRNAHDDTYRWFLALARPIRDADTRIAYWIGTATDIDAQKRATESLDFVIEVSELIASAETVAQVCTDFARAAVHGFADWCFIVLADADRRYMVPAIAHRDPARVRLIESYLERHPVSEDQQLEALLQAGHATLYSTISDDLLRRSARDAEHLAVMRELGLYSAIIAPLAHGDDVLGGIIMYSAESRRRFIETDVDVAQTLAQRAAARIAAMRALSEEQRARHRLQFIGRATQAVYESFDLTAAFGNLTQIVVSEIGDIAAVFRLEEGSAARIVGSAHRDPEMNEVVRSFVGIRPMLGEAEKRFIETLQARKPLVGTQLAPGTLERTVWPYLSEEISALAPQSLVTVPLHSRGKVHGAIVVYYARDGRKYKPEDLELLVEIGRHASVALENADVFERERRMSETLQDSLLPPSLPKVEGLSFDAVYLPSAVEAQVGGDWYDAFQLEDGTTVVSAGDVTGRGADAAVIMGKVRHLLAMAPSYDRDPARILDTVESVLARRYPDAIVTAFLGFIDAKHETIRFANAGHPAPLKRTHTGVQELTSDGVPIGLRREVAPESSKTADLRDARMLVLYTDGLTESRHDVLGGYHQLYDVVSREAVLHTHRPARFIEESCLGNAASDDVAVLTIAFDPGVRWSFDAENAKAAQDARGEFVSYLRGQCSDGFSVETAELIFGELVGNVVRHAPGAIDIDVDWSNGSPLLHVLDRGPEFMPPTNLPRDLLSESGRGLFIVRQLSKSFSIEHIPGYGNHVCVELPVTRERE